MLKVDIKDCQQYVQFKGLTQKRKDTPDDSFETQIKQAFEEKDDDDLEKNKFH
jgi:hypothetical protein